MRNDTICFFLQFTDILSFFLQFIDIHQRGVPWCLLPNYIEILWWISLEKNISLQHCQENCPLREKVLRMTLESQKRKHQERHLFLQTASAHHNPEFLCSEASSLEDSVDTQRSGQQREGLRCISCQVYHQRGSKDFGLGLLPLDAVRALTSTLWRDSSKVMERQVFLLKSGDR